MYLWNTYIYSSREILASLDATILWCGLIGSMAYVYFVEWCLSDNRGHRLARCRLIPIPVKSRYAERGVSDMHVTSAKRYEIWLLCSQIIFAWLKVIDEIHCFDGCTVNVLNLTNNFITLLKINNILKFIMSLLHLIAPASMRNKSVNFLDLHITFSRCLFPCVIMQCFTLLE